MKLKTLCLSVLLAAVGHAATAQLTVDVEVDASAATDKSVLPLWTYSNAWGRYAQYDQFAANVYANASYSLNFPLVNLNFGLSAQASTEGDRSMIHEAFVSGKFLFIDFTAGLEAFTPVSTNNGLASGSYIMSDNARPYPRVGAGIFDYVSIPFTFDVLQVKGGFFLGFLSDEGEEKYTEDFLIQEKFVYGRIGRWPLKPYIGLVHSAMMGGTLADGRKVPVDFWATFFGRGGGSDFDDSMRGERTNAAGGHQGMWDLGFNLDLTDMAFCAYYQRPFADNRAQKLLEMRKCKDFAIGLSAEIRNFKPLSAINIEYFGSDWQGGEGTPDPAFVDKNGVWTVPFPGDITFDNLYEWLDAHVPQEVMDAWEAENGKIYIANYLQFFSETFNHGEEFGGRTTYLSNSYYPQGWTRRGLSMGTPLFHTDKTIRILAGDNATQGKVPFANVRVRAVTIGASGSITNSLKYKFKYTYSRNYGNYIDQYQGGTYSWTPRENYYFEKPKTENYSAFWLKYALNNQLSVNGCVGYDFGDMYDNFMLRVGVAYRIGF